MSVAMSDPENQLSDMAVDDNDSNSQQQQQPSESLSEIPLERGETGASLPAAEEVRMSVASQQQQQRPRHRTCYALCFAILLVVMISLGIGISNNNKNAEKNRSPQDRKFSVEALAAYLEDNDVTQSATIFDYQTPQAQAAHWMANQDPRNVALPVDGVTTRTGYHFVTRYVLATLYFALGGAQWRFRFNFLSADDLCAWRDTLYVVDTGEPVPFGALCDTTTGSIHSLYLDQNYLSGTIPSEISKLTTLRAVDFNFNFNIQGPIPTDIGQLSLLNRLALSENKLTGNIPESICNMVYMERLLMGYNQLVGNIPSCIGQLRNVELLYLADNLLSGLFPASVADMTLMQMLWVDDNMLSGDISTIFDKMLFLEAIFMEENELQGEMNDQFLANNQLLIYVDLSSNDLTGFVPAHLLSNATHPGLKMLDVHNNRLGGPLPSGDMTYNALEFLSLFGNTIVGNVPDNWSGLSSLFHLDLSSNYLEGTMPEVLGNMTKLEYIFLANNTFDVGPIPESYAQLSSMEEFSVKDTQRQGPLPDWLSTWKNLTLLDLDQNDFNGPIPPSYGNLTNLEFLLLNRNNLNGEVPQTFSQLSNLRAVFLEGNSLVGRLDMLCALPTFQETEGDEDGTEILIADCSGGEQAQIVCTCCTTCCVPTWVDGSTSEGLGFEKPCHDATAIANLNPLWESGYRRVNFDFGNETTFLDRQFLN